MSDRHLFRLTMDGCAHCRELEQEVHRLRGELAQAKGARADVASRFHAKYQIAENGCWIWQGAKTWNGYGRITDGSGRVVGAHRLSYEMHHGPLGQNVCRHKCDNPACVNPAHLVAGSQMQNVQDAIDRQRMARGEARWNSKLTAKDVRVIRASTATLKEIAQRHGIAESTASMVRSGKRWSHIS